MHTSQYYNLLKYTQLAQELLELTNGEMPCETMISDFCNCGNLDINEGLLKDYCEEIVKENEMA